MPAGKLKAMRPGDLAEGEPPSSLWRDKLNEASREGTETNAHGGAGRFNPGGPSLVESVRAHGVIEPVQVWHGSEGTWLSNGHHRVATADHINPSMEVPVDHWGSGSYTYPGRSEKRRKARRGRVPTSAEVYGYDDY